MSLSNFYPKVYALMIAMPKNLPQPQLKPNTEVVLQKRYLRKSLDGKLSETPRAPPVSRKPWPATFTI